MTNFEANDLIDVYGNLLTKRQLEILQLYYQEDLSLSEIHEELDISRAAIQQTIKKSMQQLEKFEAAIGMLKLKKNLYQLAQSNLNQADMSQKLMQLLEGSQE
jgi:predicted DNA-binding protein YlxM (UPF0122 family)